MESMRTLDYIFDGPVQPSPTLNYTISQHRGSVWQGEILFDFELAKLIFMSPRERQQAAPYPFGPSDRVHPEWRDAIRKQLDDLGATKELRNNIQPRGFESQLKWSADEIEYFRQDRIDKSVVSYW